ncbi:hypothetical protein LXA43DRAFT_1104048 [Ganoderma leucocontextum]|nr:hypothetical protein LXA43DRAFT_1104048 [Ganoderma leucocontextum]
MATSPSPPSTAAIPPLNKIFLVGIWVETALWGFNTLVFLGVCYVLFWKPNSKRTRIILGGTSILLYLCVTAHVAASLRQEMEAFILVPADASPLYATLYFSQENARMAVAKNLLYTTTVFIQDLVLIWRMYVVWTNRWQIVILPLLVELAHISCAYAAVELLSRPGASIHSHILETLGTVVGWALELAVNILVTFAIASRLWYMGRKVSHLSSSGSGRTFGSNTYATTIFTLIESGAILIAVTIPMLTLFHVGNPVALVFVDIATQIAALVPYLIIVRVGMGLTHGLPVAYRSYVQTLAGESGMTFRMNNVRAKGGVNMGSTTTQSMIMSQSSMVDGSGLPLSDLKAVNGSRPSF